MHNLRVVGGNYMRSVVNATTYMGSVKRLIIHPNYSDKTNYADIAIVVVWENKSLLSTSISLTKSI